MEDYPKTILDFEQRFATEEACREYVVQLRWPEGFCCPRCGHGEVWIMKRGLYWCRQCDYQVSVTAGTIFQDSRKSLRLWFRAIWYVVNQKHGVSALGLQRVLGLGSYRTAWTWLYKLRCAIVRPGRDRLLGTVEVDETYIGGKKPGKRGRGAAGKTLVVVAVEDKGNKIGRIRLRRVADASAASLIPAVQESVEDGALVRTDGWISYEKLSSKGYEHIVVRKNASVGDNLLPLVNRVVALLKRWLQGTHQGAVRPSHLDYYLDEFTFRFNRRTSRSRGKLFYRLVQQAVAISPITGNNIRGGRSLS
ncbi:MAG: IS1595 family transposase [Candidatus Methanospirareceae archaeon]